MTPHLTNSAANLPPYPHSTDCADLRQKFDELVNEFIAPSLTVDFLARSLSDGIEEVTTILRSISGQEGRLIERGIGLVARCNPNLVVLTQNLRLPVTPAALQLVEKNNPAHYRSLTLDADQGGRKSYTPDLIILNNATRVAHVVDVKRSLTSYESTRIDDLKSRMLAAALVVPDLLYKEHLRLIAEEVRIVVLNADNQKSDIDAGIWPLSHLDHLVEVVGAGEAIRRLQKRFHARIKANWTMARQSFVRPSNDHEGPPATVAATEREEPADGAARPDDDDAAVAIGDEPRLIKLGFAQVPGRR